MQRAPRASLQQMHDQGAKKSTGAEDHGPTKRAFQRSGISGGSAISAPTKTELGRRSAAGLILEINMRKRLSVVVADENRGLFFAVIHRPSRAFPTKWVFVIGITSAERGQKHKSQKNGQYGLCSDTSRPCQVMSVLDDFVLMRLYRERASEFELLAETEGSPDVGLRYRIVASHFRELVARVEKADKARIAELIERARLQRQQTASKASLPAPSIASPAY
jgi:hypothetical protein